MLEHIDRAIHEDGHKSRELIRQFMIHTERELHSMAIDTKQLLSEVRAQRTQVSGILVLCNTLKHHLVDVLAKLNAIPGIDPSIAQDMQDMHDLLAQNDVDIAQAVTDDADVPDAPPPTQPTPPADQVQPDGNQNQAPLDGSNAT